MRMSSKPIDTQSAPNTDPVARAFAQRLRHRLGGRIREVRLFGSRARGDARESSDYDMLVVVDQRTPEIRSEILDIEVDLLDEYDVLVTSVLRSEAEWRAGEIYSFARNIAREGIAL
jgi:predicted nucleotidyltransferase